MKIDKPLSPLSSSPAGQARPAAPRTEGQAPAPSGDSVKISTLSSQLQAMGGSMASSPVDTTKVNQIKQAISEGRFKINPEAIANGLIRSVSELIQQQK